MPRAALLSIHARVEHTTSTMLDDPSLVQIWGPRFSVYVVAERDRAVFSLGRLPENTAARRKAEDLAARLCDLLDGEEMPFGKAGRALGVHPNQLRYAASTGTVLLRWDGARQPLIRTVPPPDTDPRAAQAELVRRYVHVFGPTTPDAFTKWAGIPASQGQGMFATLRSSLIPVRTPIGDAWILAADEAEFRVDAAATAAVRLLPSGDSYYLLHNADRKLLVTNPDQRDALWTSRVWPGAVLVEGEIVGTWRRSQHKVTVYAWRRLPAEAREVVEAEASSLPLPVDKKITLSWGD
jgi:hypothetical protein